jgi:EF-P beta-lysylation protein EpmB
MNLDWQLILAGAVRDPAELCRRLGLSTEAVDLATDFPVLVPEPLLDRIEPGNPTDPILLQVLPRKEERDASPEFTTDPVGENEILSPDGTLSKYRGRSLIVTSQTCGVHCRFCFRHHLPPCSAAKNDPEPIFANPEQAAAHFEADPTLHEAILSGGDPLMMEDERLGAFIERLDQIESLRRIRIHTRLPIVIPQRVTERLVEILRDGRTRRVVVLHVNHPNELDAAVARAITQLGQAGVTLFSQSVLLRGINDTEPVLAELFERLVDLGVTPYYLHQLDRVAGAAHFEVDTNVGRELIARLRDRLPGYAVPRYVREVPGAAGKVVLL